MLTTDNLNNSSDETIDFDKIIADSKENLAQKTEEKRGRGRPKGTFKKRPDNEQAAQNGATSQNTGPLPQGQAQTLKTVIPNDLEPLINEAVKAPFSIAANKFNEPKIELSEKESETPSLYLTRYIQLVLPDIEAKSPKIFNLAAFAISLLILGLKKIILIKEKINKKIEIKKEDNPDYATKEKAPEKTQVVEITPVSASSLFTKRTF